MARMGSLVLGMVALWAVGVGSTSTDPPPQCDPATVLIPGDLSILGPELNLVAGGVNHSYHIILPPALTNASLPARPVLLLHGMGATQYEWPPSFLAWLSSHTSQPIVTLDNAGIGGSVFLSSSGKFTIQSLASSTAAFIATLAQKSPAIFLPQADVLGYSMGGMIAQTLAASAPSAVHAVISVAGSPGGPHAPQPQGGIKAVLETLVKAQAGVTASNLTLFFPLGEEDPAYCSMWNAVASLQFAAGTLPLPGAGYLVSLGIVKDAATLFKSESQIQAQADAIVAHYGGDCPAGWPTRMASLCPRSTIAETALLSGTVPLAFYGGEDDLVIPPETQTLAAAQSSDYLLKEFEGAGHGIIYNFNETDVVGMLGYLENPPVVDRDRPSSAAFSVSPYGNMAGMAAAAAAFLASQAF